MGIYGRIKSKIQKIYFNHLSPLEKSKYLKDKVYHMGENVYIFTNAIGTEPYLLSFGDNVIVASSVSFITHDVSAFTVTRYLGLKNTLDKVGPIILKDNLNFLKFIPL